MLLRSGSYRQTGVESLQYIPKPGTQYYQQLKTGRLNWNPTLQEKWTLNAGENERQFHNLNIWTPSRGGCAKNNSSPDIFFSMFSEKNVYMLADVQFDTFTVVAVACELNYDPLPEILQLSEALKAKRTVYRRRGWQQKPEDENWNFINSIQDTMSANIYKGGKLQETAFDKIQFTPFWEIII
jgi:hypothetical protein